MICFNFSRKIRQLLLKLTDLEQFRISSEILDRLTLIGLGTRTVFVG